MRRASLSEGKADDRQLETSINIWDLHGRESAERVSNRGSVSRVLKSIQLVRFDVLRKIEGMFLDRMTD